MTPGDRLRRAGWSPSISHQLLSHSGLFTSTTRSELKMRKASEGNGAQTVRIDASELPGRLVQGGCEIVVSEYYSSQMSKILVM